MAKVGTKLVALVVIFLIVGIVVGYPLGYFTAPPQVVEKTVEVPVEKTIEVPVEKTVEVPVYPLKGEILIGAVCASPGSLDWNEATIDIALEDVNAYVKSLGLPITFRVLVESAEESAVKAFEEFQSLAAKGVKFYIEFRWSSHISACKEYADENKLLILSDGSTSPLLSVPDDYVFRLIQDDTFQGKAIARKLVSYGIKAVLVLQRADTWGDGLYGAFEKRFTELGGVIVDHVRYDPAKTEFSAELAGIAAKIPEAVGKYGEGKVVFLPLCFEEVVMIQSQAADYPEFMALTWFGSEGHAGGPAKRLVEEAGELALITKHIYVSPATAASPKYTAFVDRFVPLVGYEPPVYAPLLYDSIWIIAKAILEAGTYDAEVVKSVLPSVSEAYFGASGWCTLNEAGDRAGGNYDIFAVVKEEGVIKWRKVGLYDYVKDEVTWFVEIPM